MCEQTEINYLDGEVVWVKLGSCWWPGEVVGPDKLPPDVLPSFRKPPIAVVKFFQEDAYEYVKNLNSIYKYNCNRKNEFINKGLYMYRTKHGHMEKFPEDVIRAEAAVGGDITILTRDEFQETKKKSYADLFGDPSKRTPQSSKKGRGIKGKSSDAFGDHSPIKINVNKPNYKVHILVQGSQATPTQAMSSETASTPSTSRAGSEPSDENKLNVELPVSTPPTTPKVSTTGMYSCHACPFTTARLNVLILHNKTHSVTFMPYTPSPIRKKLTKPSKSSPNSTKTSKARKSRPEKIEKVPKKSMNQKRVAEDKPIIEVKKLKTDEEIKSSLLADWDIDDDSNDESSVIVMTGSPEVAAPAESPAVAPPAELPEAQVPIELPVPISKSSEDLAISEKPESSSDSKYEFCEDEDWLEEADVGRKIPRVMNPKRKEDTKSISLDEDEVAREVAELLNKTTVPELPSAPEPLKVEENFPEPSIVKSPDKKSETVIETVTGDSPEQKPPIEAQPTKTIFKTKTFFRSRHSRSQDAIGKYVAEQLNAERIDMSEDINGSEILQAEARISPPIVEPVKVARLAPKIQLKKLKAEAAQMREKEKKSADKFKDDYVPNNLTAPTFALTSLSENLVLKNNEMEIEEAQEKYDFALDQMKLNSPNDITQIEVEHLTKADDISFDQLQNRSPKEFESIYDHINIDVKSVIEPDLKKDIQEKKKLDIVPLGVHSPSITDSQYHMQSNEREQTVDISPKEETPGVTNNNLQQSHDNTSHTSEEREVGEKQNNESHEQHCAKDNEEILCQNNLDEVDNIGECNDNVKLNESHTMSDVTSKIKSGEKKSDTNQEIPHRSNEPYMNESTASAVDALLSVSRETDRVTRLISNDLPEDLFEDDNKDSSPRNLNGFVECSDSKSSLNAIEEMEIDKVQEVTCDEVIAAKTNENFKTNSNTISSNECVDNDTPLKSTSIIVPESSPSESDLQIAETLINLPSTTIQNKASVDHQENINLENKPFEDEVSFSNKRVELENNKVGVSETCVEDNIEIPANHITSTDNLTSRFETEEEKSENLYAAQSLVQMSESIEHKISIAEVNTTNKKDKSKPLTYIPVKDHDVVPVKGHEITSDQKLPILTIDKTNEASNDNKNPFEINSPKLLKILEEPCSPKISSSILTKQVIVPVPEKILNFDGGKPGVSGKTHSQKQKIIIRRSNTPHKNLLNNVTEVSTPDKIILSRSNNASQEGSSVQTYTIQTAAEAPTDPNTIVIQQKVRKISKPSSKLQKIKPQSSVVSTLQAGKVLNDVQKTEDIMFDINSMPIVLSEDILTPESIEKMPIVMSDGNILPTPSIPQKTVKPKQNVMESEKIAISPTLQNNPKQEFKTLIVNPVNDSNKVTTPNILSKSSKLRGTKMFVIDKTSGKQKIIMTKQATHTEPTIKELKCQPTLIKTISQNVAKPQPTLIQAMPQNSSKLQSNLIQPIVQNTNKAHTSIIQSIPQNTGKNQPSLIQSISQTANKPEKFILLPTTASPRPGTRTQKIVIDPQTGKTHMFLGKGSDSPMQVTDSKPVSAKLVSSPADATAPGNTVMIITNAQGAQSRIVLKPEHEKILFPNKQQPNVSQLKTVTHRVSATSGSSNKSIVTTVPSVKTPTRIVPKQKGAIITSKGQLIVGGRVATTAQNIAPMPEIRPAPKRIISSDPKKISIQKNSNEPLIFFQQKSGAMMQLTAAQFEHLQRTGQIIQKTLTPAARESKVVVQKTINISSNDTVLPNITKPRVRKQPTATAESSTPIKKIKHEIPIAPTPTPMPTLCPISNTVASTTIPPTLSSPSPSASTYSGLENFEELLPSTAIARQPEPPVVQPEPAPPPALSDSQLLAVPGEHFGGPQGSFYLCVEENGTFTPIDNRPLVLENNQLVPMPESVPALVQPERRDILEAALANSDVFHGETRDETPDFRDLNANVSVHCRVSETSTTLNQPIMTAVEVPSKADSEPAVPSNLEDGLAVIGVTPQAVPTSLELPITVTDPRIALKTTDPLSGNNYGTTLLPSPNTEMSFVSTEDVEVAVGGPISMPLLTDDESVGKSMPILTDDVAEKTVSSVESTTGSPSSLDVRDSETDDGSQWPQRLNTPSSDASDRSCEIPLRPQLKLSVSDIK